MAFADHVPFPCKQMPADGRQSRLLGVYGQRPQGLFFQRVRVPGGCISSQQWEGLAALAEEYASGYPLHLTTRQDIELHGVRPEDIPALQRGVSDLGLSGGGACGDTARNITCCPGNGFALGTWDVSALAGAIQAKVQSLDWITDLPRKFKIAICGCFESCTRPWINDLGLVANHDGTFKAVVAGSLGAKPGTGIVLYEALSAAGVLPLAVALLRLFHAEGDRTRRHRARLRHVRERLGDEVFRSRADALFQEELRNSDDDGPGIVRVTEDAPLQARLYLPLGDITPEAAMRLSSAATASGAILRIGLDHDLLLYGRRPVALHPDLEAFSASAPVLACPGSTWCTKGIVDSRGAAVRIGRRVKLPTDSAVAVCGCPNNCSEAAVTPIGLVGRVHRMHGRPVEGFKILAGGARGRGPELARELCGFVPAEEVVGAVGLIVDEYTRERERDETLDFGRFLSEEHESLAKALEERHGVSGRKRGEGDCIQEEHEEHQRP